ncbi:ester cyclase [Saccharospirillum salsuginis]|uniref:Ester cyclase n=1 Tax=Saccharospirillum salsuginis TaxID=418750 RepID=A0A918KAW0_9GAMM|nr:ester cyclase [Saccharospirillum salsuginis]GGX57023.1 hypothetical protein GCM10007392_25650 [Saccharospirillum salsuginis]
MSKTQRTERNEQIVERFLIESHGNRPEVVDELVTEDVRLHGFPGGDPANRDEYKQFFVNLNAAFPGMTTQVPLVIANDHYVAARWRVVGTHRAPFAGIPATGKNVDFSGMVIYRMEGDRIAETWLQPDSVTLLQQLGAMPEPEAA